MIEADSFVIIFHFHVHRSSNGTSFDLLMYELQATSLLTPCPEELSAINIAQSRPKVMSRSDMSYVLYFPSRNAN